MNIFTPPFSKKTNRLVISQLPNQALFNLLIINSYLYSISLKGYQDVIIKLFNKFDTLSYLYSISLKGYQDVLAMMSAPGTTLAIYTVSVSKAIKTKG